jgi:hypothetical protein
MNNKKKEKEKASLFKHCIAGVEDNHLAGDYHTSFINTKTLKACYGT